MPLKILIFGDSLAEGLGWSYDKVTIECFPGRTTESMIYDFPNLEFYLKNEIYDLVVLLGGANDDYSNEAVRNLLQMHQQCESANIKSIAVSLMHDKFNNKYKEICQKYKIPICEFMCSTMDKTYIDDDNIHLSLLGKSILSLELEDICKMTANLRISLIPPPLNCKKNKRWIQALTLQDGYRFELLKTVFCDAIKHKKIAIKRSSNYYSCAKFLCVSFKFKFKRLKTMCEYKTTCCRAYPKLCGGKCCFNACGCSQLPKTVKHIKNCYDDCCQIVKVRKPNKQWSIQW